MRELEHWRRAVGRAVEALGGDRDAMSLGRLSVSELLTNVVRHAADPRCRLRVERDGETFCVKVFDRCRQVPVVTVPDWDSESGRGLWMLREMTRDLGYTCTPGGKWVWVRCDLVSGAEQLPVRPASPEGVRRR